MKSYQKENTPLLQLANGFLKYLFISVFLSGLKMK